VFKKITNGILVLLILFSPVVFDSARHVYQIEKEAYFSAYQALVNLRHSPPPKNRDDRIPVPPGDGLIQIQIASTSGHMLSAGTSSFFISSLLPSGDSSV
jgi:hypothetical protein